MSYVAETWGPEGLGNYRVDWADGHPSFQRVSRPAELVLIPGFVDIHFHGAFGLDFMSASRQDLLVLAEKLERQGYEACLLTTVTASPEAVRAALANFPDHPMYAGFHLEGPFIAPEYPGAQPPSAISDPPPIPSNWDSVLDDFRMRVITLAPERPHALELIARLSGRGVIVSLGHTNATYEQARYGFEFGARHTTHTFNAMRPLHHREAGMVGYALAQDDLTSELIYDRLHVCRDAAALLLKSKPSDRVIAVSDSTMATGLPPNQKLEMWGLEVVTGRGEVRLASNGALAGSAITLRDAFQNLAEDFGLETAIRLCCVNPRRALGRTEVQTWVELDRDYQVIGRRVLS